MKTALGLLLMMLTVKTANADTLAIRDVRLQLVNQPLQSDYVKATLITFYGDGIVEGRTCYSGAGQRATRCESMNIDHLNLEKQKEIDALIALAAKGQPVEPERSRPCPGEPFRKTRYSADNDQVFLQGGTYPCGGHSYNDTRAAQSLIEIMNGALGKYQRLIRTEN